MGINTLSQCQNKKKFIYSFFYIKAFELPAPGIYEVLRKKRLGSSFGKEDRFRLDKIKFAKPGPGAYNVGETRK